MEAGGEEQKDIVIVGGGICGLATALALHRKGIESVVLERSDKLRATGAAIIIQPNGWRALSSLGVASKLLNSAVPILGSGYITVETGKRDPIPLGEGGIRCLRRTALMQALADELPPNTLRFGCNLISVKLDPFTSYPVLEFEDGSVIKAKVVIGCDGVNSRVSDYLGMKPTRLFDTCALRGISSYENGHDYKNEFILVSKGSVQLGRMPMTDKLVYWFITRNWTSQDSIAINDPELIRRSAIKSLSGFPEEEIDLIRESVPDYLFLTPLRYQAPWSLLLSRKFREGTMTVAGDAMHAMGPFLAQGGSAALEDAVVFARCFAPTARGIHLNTKEWKMTVEMAIDQYLKERKKRVLQLSTQTFLIGMLLDASWVPVKLFFVLLLAIFFRDPLCHTLYNCGQL